MSKVNFWPQKTHDLGSPNLVLANYLHMPRNIDLDRTTRLVSGTVISILRGVSELKSQIAKQVS